MDSFDVYSKHFTVMNYRDSENLKQVCFSFLYMVFSLFCKGQLKSNRLHCKECFTRLNERFELQRRNRLFLFFHGHC